MPAINSGVIVPANDDFRFAFQTGADKDTSFECYFAHDRLQETAYGMVDASEKAALHLHTARHISQLAGNSGDPELLMMIANHYNEAADLISEKEEKLKAAEFNTQAGNRAVRAAAYDSAFHYFSGAWKLLTEEDWNLNYPLMLSAGGSLAETAFFAGKFREAEETALTVIHHAADKKDSLQARYVLLLTYTALNRLNDVLNEGSKALRILNIRIPVKANPYHIVKSMIRVRMILRRHKVEDLVHLPEMDNKDMLLAMKIMQKMTPVAFRSGSNMFPVLIFNLAYITARFGLAPISIFAFGAYSIALCGVLGDTDKGYRFGKLIMEMPKHIKGGNSVISHAVFLWNNFIRHWKEPIALYVDDFMQAYRNGFENGYLFEVVWTAHHRSLWSFFTGRELVSIRSQLDEIQDLVYVDKAADDMVRALRQTCSNLADPGCPEPWNLYGEFYNDSDADSYAPTEKAFYYLKKMLLYMIFDRHPEALAAVEKGDKVADALTSMPGYSLQIFLSALIRLRAYRKIRKERKHLVYAQKAVKKFRKWAADVPATHLHRQYLIQAEIYRAEGKINKASEFFDLAVDAVQKGEARLNVLEEAIVFEKAADFFLETGRRIYARSLVQYAYSSYDRIGAAAKTEFIKRRFPDFSWAVYRAPGESYSESVSMSVSTRSSSESSAATGGGSLDLISIIKSTQAISGEMVLDDLLKKVMTFIMENAGADKGTLMINDLNSSGLYVRCVGNAADKENTVRLLNEPAEGYDDIPHSVIQLVLRSRKEVVTDNPVEERKFDSDPYFKEKRPRSLLCMPVMYQGRSNGVLYLENSLNHGAFNQNRLQIISMITVQAAVSIHNAMLYESVKDSWQKERELKNAYRSFVPEEFLSILGKGSILEVKPGDYKETQMTVMFSDIRSFTSLSETMSPQDNFRFLNEFLHKMEPAITENHGFIDKYIGDSIMALFPHKADDAVAAGVAMMQRLKSYNRQRAENGQPEIRIGIGINSGHLMLGTIGTRGRMDGTVISDAVNIASRLESANKKLGTTMLISEETYKQLSEPEKFNIEQLGSVQLRGRNESIMIYEVKE